GMPMNFGSRNTLYPADDFVRPAVPTPAAIPTASALTAATARSRVSRFLLIWSTSLSSLELRLHGECFVVGPAHLLPRAGGPPEREAASSCGPHDVAGEDRSEEQPADDDA